MKIGFSQPRWLYNLRGKPEIIPTATTLGLPTKGFVQRRVAHAYDSTLSNQVMEIDDGIFRVRSQSEPQKSYIVNINRGHPSCDCPDGQRTINCKHRIASLLIASQSSQRRLRQEIDALTIHALERSEGTDETHKSCNQKGRWIVTDDQDKVVYHIYQDGKGRLICPCGRKSDCKHRKAIKEYISKNKIKNEYGTEFALEIQEKLNRHLNRLKNSTKGPALERSEGSKDPSQLAKRNAAGQLLPLAEMVAIEKKAQLEAEFDWQVAYEKCIKVAGTKANVDITINELVKASKLRQDNPSHYNRTEWLTIYNACKNDNDVVKSRSIGTDWKDKLRDCKEIALNDTRFNWIKTDLMRENALRQPPNPLY